MTKQKEAVFLAISALFGTTSFTGKVELTPDQRKDVQAELIQGFKDGTIQFDGPIPEEAKLKSYVSGLVSNWLRKDKRLNGNTTYVPLNPGSRVGAGDESMKAMRTLLTLTTDAEAKAKIQEEIDKRAAEMKPTAKREINVSALPESLRHLAPQA